MILISSYQIHDDDDNYCLMMMMITYHSYFDDNGDDADGDNDAMCRAAILQSGPILSAFAHSDKHPAFYCRYILIAIVNILIPIVGL